MFCHHDITDTYHVLGIQYMYYIKWTLFPFKQYLVQYVYESMCTYLKGKPGINTSNSCVNALKATFNFQLVVRKSLD